MTNEEALEIIGKAQLSSKYTSTEVFQVKRAFQHIKSALEQEPILDKIRAEIIQMDFDFGDFYDHTDTIKEMVLEVIDKYKAESEDE